MTMNVVMYFGFFTLAAVLGGAVGWHGHCQLRCVEHSTRRRARVGDRPQKWKPRHRLGHLVTTPPPWRQAVAPVQVGKPAGWDTLVRSTWTTAERNALTPVQVGDTT